MLQFLNDERQWLWLAIFKFIEVIIFSIDTKIATTAIEMNDDTLIGTTECFTDYSIFSDYLLDMNFQRTSKFLRTLTDFFHLFFRYEARRPGDIPQHSSRKASVHVLSHLVQGDSPCLQEIHARCRQL